ncbi:hypothetical protein [Kribbella sp. NBC_00359]|uniref:hypothetical protein n=1 Tax=Kribbella sp. NBC_00359 TaxID=2975966 RepID=UPI002E1E2250
MHAEALKQMSTAITWLIGALAAVAAAMIAGSQLSSIGRLSWDDDRSRLLLAVISIAVAIGLILVSIGLLYRVQAPTNTDFNRLRKLAAGTRRHGVAAEVRRQVEDDSTLHRGTGSLASLMTEFNTVRSEFHELKNKEYAEEKQAVGGGDDTARTAAVARRKQLAAYREVVGSRMTEYRTALLRVAQLDKYLRTRKRYRFASWTVIVLSIAAALAFVAFAWAANPADKPKDATAPRLVAAHLTLTDEGRKGLEQRLGKTCAAAAATDGGVSVVALSSSDAGIEVVIVPSTECPQPKRVVVSASDGDVVADAAAVSTASPR